MARSTAIFRTDDTAQFAHARAIREAVFCVEQQISPELEWDGCDGACTHFVLYEAGEPVATARVRAYAPGIFKVERVAVLKSRRGTGAGVAIMEAALTFLRSDPSAGEALLHAQIAVEGFYAKLGFATEGGIFSEADIPHVAMRLRLRTSDKTSRG